MERFREALVAALDEAGGLDVGFSIAWPTGRTGSPRIEVDTEEGRRWVARSLSRAYAGAQWIGAAAEPRTPVLARWGRADLVGGLPPLDPRQGTPWSEVAVRGLRSLPEGALVRWSLGLKGATATLVPQPPAIERVHLPPGAVQR